MNQERLKEALGKFLQNRKAHMIIALFISIGIFYFLYEKKIKPTRELNVAEEKKMTSLDPKKAKKEISKLEKEKKEVQASYKKIKDEFDKLYATIPYKDNYSIMIGVLEELNRKSFNMYKFDLDKAGNKLKLNMTGSYQNLIYLFDFFGSFAADIIIDKYKLSISKEKKLVIDLSITVKPIKI